ncbi:MAG: ribonuclease P protein component [Actinomycetota bacterium]|nr:ribonuclease P protein component [Actinomycetota bacterium]MDP2287361.1 ribonuclease P protein component [Actinomycetota bacterium]
MLAAPFRLRQSADFQATVRQGVRAGRTNLVVHLLCRQVDEPARIGFTVGAQVGGSVTRHRLTRQLRALSRPLLPSLPAGTNVVVRALPTAATVEFQTLAVEFPEALASALRKAQR